MSSQNMFIDKPDASLYGGLATAIPGEIAGYWAAHQIAGKLPWTDLFTPTIELCQNGFRVNAELDWAISSSEDGIRSDPGMNSIFVNSTTNKAFKINDLIKYPQLAKTLQIIADGGAKAFYDGELSPKIIAENNLKGGILTLEDLQNYQPEITTPIQADLNNNYKYYGVPPPSSGILISFILNLMSSKFKFVFKYRTLLYFCLKTKRIQFDQQ
jgi:gamma-glutamyltranspeptidase/glutathione hydrolase/leukotriene-C4 hydrolase